jgi:hypothetical protein
MVADRLIANYQLPRYLLVVQALRDETENLAFAVRKDRESGVTRILLKWYEIRADTLRDNVAEYGASGFNKLDGADKVLVRRDPGEVAVRPGAESGHDAVVVPGTTENQCAQGLCVTDDLDLRGAYGRAAEKHDVNAIQVAADNTASTVKIGRDSDQPQLRRLGEYLLERRMKRRVWPVDKHARRRQKAHSLWAARPIAPHAQITF